MLKKFRKSIRKTFKALHLTKASNSIELKSKVSNEKDSFNSKSINCTVNLLDNTVIKITLKLSSLGSELINRVLISLDLLERDYFGLIFFNKDKKQQWLDPTKTVTHQIKNGKFLFYFQVKFYPIDPDELTEELTRYQFFLQLKADIINKKLKIPPSKIVDLFAYSIQSEIGDYEPSLDNENNVESYKFIPNLTKELLKDIVDRYRSILGLTPSECEKRFLRLVKNIEFYGVSRHLVKVDENIDYELGISPIGFYLIKNDQKVSIYQWMRIVKVSFRSNYVKITISNKLLDGERTDSIKIVPINTSNKELWKICIEFHSFYRLIKISQNERQMKSFLKFGSKYRFIGKTLFEASTTNQTSVKKSSSSVKRSNSLTSPIRATVGYIRIGSRVWVKAQNNEYYRGTVIGLSDKVYVKSDDGQSFAHERFTMDGIIYDVDPHISELQINTKVIGYWPGIQSYLTGIIEKIEATKFLIRFEDGDSRFNSLEQIRIIKPPQFFGPGSNATYLHKRFSTMKTTSFPSTSNAVSNPANNTTNYNKPNNMQPVTINTLTLIDKSFQNKLNPNLKFRSFNSFDTETHHSSHNLDDTEPMSDNLVNVSTTFMQSSTPLKPPRTQGMNGSNSTFYNKIDNESLLIEKITNV